MPARSEFSALLPHKDSNETRGKRTLRPGKNAASAPRVVVVTKAAVASVIVANIPGVTCTPQTMRVTRNKLSYKCNDTAHLSFYALRAPPNS